MCFLLFSGCRIEIGSERNHPRESRWYFHCFGRETENWCFNKPIPLLTQTNVTYDNYISDADYDSYISDTFMNKNWAWVKPIGDDGWVSDSASSIRCTCPTVFDSIEYDIPRHTIKTPWVFTTDFDESSGIFTK